MRIVPCKGCTKRAMGCHTDCEDYIAWKKDRDEFIEDERATKPQVICKSDFNRTGPRPGRSSRARKYY